MRILRGTAPSAGKRPVRAFRPDGPQFGPLSTVFVRPVRCGRCPTWSRSTRRHVPRVFPAFRFRRTSDTDPSEPAARQRLDAAGAPAFPRLTAPGGVKVGRETEDLYSDAGADLRAGCGFFSIGRGGRRAAAPAAAATRLAADTIHEWGCELHASQ